MNNILPAGTVESINQREMGVKRTLIVRTIKTKYEAISAVEKKIKVRNSETILYSFKYDVYEN